jgi:hypothetical protein
MFSLADPDSLKISYELTLDDDEQRTLRISPEDELQIAVIVSRHAQEDVAAFGGIRANMRAPIAINVTKRVALQKTRRITMRTLNSLAVLFALGCHVPLALADDATATISSPTDGAKLSRTTQTIINYEVIPGSNGDHVHLYVDDKQAGALRQLKGSHTLELLAPGKHEICIKVANKGHSLIGVSQCIKVSVE